jgi:hypothetical protein
MSQCTVNGSQHDTESGLETWGQLLATLEQGEGPDRSVVTAVRFAGVVQPTFREPSTLALDLKRAAPVDVETSKARDLVVSARQTALAGLDALATGALQVAEAFRLHDLPRAHRGLGEFVGTFGELTQLTALLSVADAQAGTPLPSVTPEAEYLAQMGTSLESLIACDLNEDWLSVADILEYEIAGVLPRWATLLKQQLERNAA